MAKRALEKRMREEEEATAHVFQEFLHAFQNVPVTGKTFVKSETLFSNQQNTTSLSGRLYIPTPIIKTVQDQKDILECVKIVKDECFWKPKEKTKSNLELLKDELKQRHLVKDELKEAFFTPPSYYNNTGDPNTTNLFIANLKSGYTESNLMEEFGYYGPLASVKIMWPRGDNKGKYGNVNCGFVAYMSRRDAERALAHFEARTDMRVGWGKSVELPSHPIYVPARLLQLYLPPPPSNLPFNARGGCGNLKDTAVRVTVPMDKKVLHLVHRMVEFVVKEGPMFEAIIMHKELRNPDYSFLFDNKCPVHIYYRWRLFSVLQGDSLKNWKKEPFRMFRKGSIWLPPEAPNYHAGMPDELFKDAKKSSLSDTQCRRLIELIQNLNSTRTSIADAMVFCMNHSAAIADSVDVIVDSLASQTAQPPRLISRLYLLSDVLSNCSRTGLNIPACHKKIDQVLRYLRDCFVKVSRESDKLIFQAKALKVLSQLESIGLLTDVSTDKFEDFFKPDEEKRVSSSEDEEPLDGVSLIKRSLKNVEKGDECVITGSLPIRYFVPSKWDTVDPEDVAASVVSASSIYFMEKGGGKENMKPSDSSRKQRKKKKSDRH